MPKQTLAQAVIGFITMLSIATQQFVSSQTNDAATFSVKMSTSVVEDPNPVERLRDSKQQQLQINRLGQYQSIPLLYYDHSTPMEQSAHMTTLSPRALIDPSHGIRFGDSSEQQFDSEVYGRSIYSPNHESGKIQDYSTVTTKQSLSSARNLFPLTHGRSQEIAPTVYWLPKMMNTSEDGLAKRQNYEDHNELEYRCQSRSLKRMLRGARNILSEGISSVEQYTTMAGNIMLGSSLLAASIPLIAFLLPDSDKNKRASLDNELPGSRFSLQARVDSVMGWIERSVEHLPNFPRLHPQECVKRSICEAHNEPNKYGAIGLVLRFLFPAFNLSITDKMDNMEYKVINKYRHAAGFGLNKRIESNGTSLAVCAEKYEDCVVSLLDVAKNLVDLFLK